MFETLELAMKSLAAETKALQIINDAIAHAVPSPGGAITIACGRFTETGITHAQKAERSDKADFILMAKESPKLYISHKANGFCWNGYGSGGKKAFEHRSPYRDKKIWEFAKWAANYCVTHQKTRVVREGIFEWTGPERGVWCFPPASVQNLIVYGPKFDESYGPFNCHIAAVGEPILENSGDCFRLSFNGGVESNGDIPKEGDAPIISIGGRIGAQTNTYLTDEKTGFHGWLGFFPYRLIEKSQENRDVSRKRRGKGDGLVKVDWPPELG